MNIAVLHPQCRVRGGAIKMALLSAQSLRKQGHHVIFYTFDHDPECFPELQDGLTIVTGKTTKASVIPAKDEVREVESRGRQTIPLELARDDGKVTSSSNSKPKSSKGDILDKQYAFWGFLYTIFPRFSATISIAWDIRHVDIVIAHNPPMQIVGALAKIFSIFSSYRQRLVVIWWHHHIPWYYIPRKMQNAKSKMQNEGKQFDLLLSLTNFFSAKWWKGFFERHYILPRVKYLVATSYYTAYCIEKYCGRKAIVIHPVIMNNEVTATNSPLEGGGGTIGKKSGVSITDGGTPPNPLASKGESGTRPITLFTHGRLEPGKGMDILVKVWKELKQMKNEQGIMIHEGIKLIIAGEGSLKNWLIEQGATVISYQDSVLLDIKKTENDILAIYLSTIDAFGMAPLEAQIAGLPVIILDKGGARETVLLDNNQAPMAQLIDTENEILPAITYFIQQRTLHKRVSNVNFCHPREYFTMSRLDSNIHSLIDSVR